MSGYINPNQFTDWLEKQSGDIAQSPFMQYDPLADLFGKQNSIQQPDIFQEMLGVGKRAQSNMKEINIDRPDSRSVNRGQEEPKVQGPRNPQEPDPNRAKQDPEANERARASSARSQASPWIGELTEEQFRMGGSSPAMAADTVLKNSGIEVSPELAMKFMEQSKQMVIDYNSSARDSERSISHYLDMLAGNLQVMKELEESPAPVPDASGSDSTGYMTSAQLRQGPRPSTIQEGGIVPAGSQGPGLAGLANIAMNPAGIPLEIAKAYGNKIRNRLGG